MARSRQHRKKESYYFGFLRNGTEAGEWIKCKTNPLYFMKTYIKIDHPMLGLIPFAMFIFQDLLVRTFLKQRNTIILKPRQMGITTVVAAYVLWFCMFHGYKKVVLISIKFSTAKGMLKRIKTMYRNLPDFLKEPTTNGSTAGDVGTAHEIEFANHSVISAVASSEDAARSEASSLIVMDEAAFIKQASGIWAASQPTLSTGGSSIVLSTAFGMGNFFHQSWVAAIQGQNRLYPVKLNWQMHPDRDMDWYYRERADLGFKRTMQEIDCDFLQSGMNVFNMDKIRAIEERLNTLNPIFTEQVGFEGQIIQYFEPDPTMVYTIGADISTGRSRDYSAFSIYDQRGKEVACYKGKIQPRQFAHVMMKWGYKYGYAMLAPEINSIGEAPLAIMQENGYENIYNNVATVLKINEWEKRESEVMGWVTTGKSRHEMITGYDEDLEQDLIEPNNPYMVKEAYTFIYDNNNKPVALGKGRGNSKSSEYYEDTNKAYSDDAIIGECITNAVRKSPQRFSKGYVPIFMGGT